MNALREFWIMLKEETIYAFKEFKFRLLVAWELRCRERKADPKTNAIISAIVCVMFIVTMAITAYFFSISTETYYKNFKKYNYDVQLQTIVEVFDD